MNLQEGFTIITGETGAGKSIMLGALSLLLGRRADLGTIRNPEKKCVIEGSFEISAYHLKELFALHDLDYESNTIIRREILPSGKSRAFVNDTPTTLNSLQALGGRLLDIHSQLETRVLADTEYQFTVVDLLAGNEEKLNQYKDAFSAFKEEQKALGKLIEAQSSANKEYDYNLFLLNELQDANLYSDMQQELEERLEELSHVEQLQEQLGAAIQHLQQEEIGAANVLKEAGHNLQRIAGISATFEQLHERLKSVTIELDDISADLEAALEKVESNPAELEEVSDRLQVLYNLQKKHAVASVAELQEIQEDLNGKIAVTQNMEEDIASAEKRIEGWKKELRKLSMELHQNRKKAVPEFINRLEDILSRVGMPNARLKIEFDFQEEFLTNGQDKMRWLLAANKGGNYNDLKKAASGGEMSRIMLAVKSILATYSKLPTIIFDEIDTGVSGDIAQKMAGILQNMGQVMQVIAITHLPQIAGKGSYHFKIYKEDAGNKTITRLQELTGETRIQELAMMLGGKNVSESAVAHAKELLN